MSPLITAEDLARSLGEVELFDLRWSLTDPTHGARSYESGHIPGAVFVDLEADLAGTEGDGRHPLPTVSTFVATLGRIGVAPHSSVVVYDDVAGAVAARMWWMLVSIGHRDIRVLDGGLDAWIEEDRPLERGWVEPAPAHYPEVDGFTGVVHYDQLVGRVVADVRAPERYRGDTEPIDPKAGHIPGSVNIPLALNLEHGRFRSTRALADLYRDFPADGVVSCGSGVNACHAALALTIAGHPMPDVYIGSFSDWSRRDLPVSVGPNP